MTLRLNHLPGIWVSHPMVRGAALWALQPRDKRLRPSSAVNKDSTARVGGWGGLSLNMFFHEC